MYIVWSCGQPVFKNARAKFSLSRVGWATFFWSSFVKGCLRGCNLWVMSPNPYSGLDASPKNFIRGGLPCVVGKCSGYVILVPKDFTSWQVTMTLMHKEVTFYARAWHSTYDNWRALHELPCAFLFKQRTFYPQPPILIHKQTHIAPYMALVGDVWVLLFA